MIDGKRIVAVTGGIGSGKSLVCRILRDLGLPVYTCDDEARRLQESDPEMRRRIASEICPGAICADGSLDRKALARCVFSDPVKLQLLNHIVHKKVEADFIRQVRQSPSPVWIVETAILYASGFDRLADHIWEVTAPRELRISRAMSRSGLTRRQVEERMAMQEGESRPGHTIIVNDGNTPILQQINELAQRL